jgi:hypothetical protein
MDEKKAAEIYDYIDDNHDKTLNYIARGLKLSIKEAYSYCEKWAKHVRAEFIFMLTKKE